MDAESVGRLLIQLWEDESELVSLRKCGDEIAAQLRVVADCLSTKCEEKVVGFCDNMFYSDHRSSAYAPGHTSSEFGRAFLFPQHFEKVMRDIHALETRIEVNKAKLEEEKVRLQS